MDGIRALAASYVVLFHAVLGFAGNDLSGRWRLLRGAFGFGHEAVAVFIVLSGYCLMLPVVGADGYSLRGTLGSFFRRRARRILPPYFATLALSLLAIALLPPLRRAGTGTIWDDSLPAFEPRALLAHLVLLHNWLPDLAYRINGPLWSVASEWQIYFFFPLLLLPLWRRGGPGLTLGVAVLVGYTPLLLVRAPSMAAIPWYLFLFTLGMIAASKSYGPAAAQGSAPRSPWGSLAAASWLGCAAFGLGAAKIWFQLKPLTDALVGGATAFTLIYLAELTARERTAAPARRHPLLWLLESRPALAVGHFSYSLYLTHLPVVALCYFAIAGHGLSASAVALLTMATSLPSSLLVAYLFHLVFERRFMVPAPTRSQAR
ncbi:MAG TPA: acyltransferase [Polyangiaceae bacterium]|nr:acyltransferase [Polyangiaceae bacterium]